MAWSRSGRVRSAAALAAAAGALACAAGPAQAYDRGSCSDLMYTAFYEDVRIDTGTVGKVDFGDVLHLGGVPHGSAVVCWSGGAGVVGRVFADSSDYTDAAVSITFYMVGGTTRTYSSAVRGKWAYSGVIRERSSGDCWKVRIRLYSNGVLQHSSNHYKEDAHI